MPGSKQVWVLGIESGPGRGKLGSRGLIVVLGGVRDFGKFAYKKPEKNIKVVESASVFGYNCGVLPVALEEE